MTRNLLAIALAGSALLVGVVAMADEKAEAKGIVYRPTDGKSFDVTDKDVVRFEGPSPGSTGYRTTVTVTEGQAKVSELSIPSRMERSPICSAAARWNLTFIRCRALLVR